MHDHIVGYGHFATAARGARPLTDAEKRKNRGGGYDAADYSRQHPFPERIGPVSVEQPTGRIGHRRQIVT